jgi:hypothetical protein
MSRKICLPILLFCFSLSFNIVKAQQSIPLFFEKAYLHTDRAFYAGGDNIWFKAYIMNPRTNNASTASNNLYVELYDPKAKLIKRETIRLEEGMGKGDLKLQDSIEAGTYHIRAYTNWMRNFGSHFFFEKDIQVASIAKATTNSKPVLANSIQFFPEGGTMVANSASLVSFKVLNSYGKGIEAKGAVFSEKGDTVAHFSTTYFGMGNFSITPMPDLDYKAIVWFKDGSNAIVDLPSVYAQGYTISIKQQDTSIVLDINGNKTTLTANPSNEVILAGRNAGKLLYKEKIALKDGKATVRIGNGQFPNGIAAFTVYDDKLRPNAERLVYIERKNQFANVTVSTDKKNYSAKDKVELEITAKDIDGKPITANLSVSVVDEGLVKSSYTNIASYINLESELKGNIENPAIYFDESNTNRLQQLDLLLRTQGWRSFLWRQIADTTYSIKYLPEPGISIAGSVKETFGKKPLPNMNITLMAAGAKGNKLYFTKTDSLGRYYLDGLPLYGTQPIKLSSKNDKGKKGGIIMMDTVKQAVTYSAQAMPFPETNEIKAFAEESAKRWAINKKTDAGNLTIEGVTVTSKARPTTARDGTVETKMGFSFASKVNPDDKQFGTVENYLIHKTHAISDVEMEGVSYPINGKLVRPRIVVDNREDVFERVDYYAIPIDQVISINVNQALAATDGGMVDRVVIHLTLKPGAYNQDLALLMTEIDGYYEARTFYAPTYLLESEKKKTDARTTIFWEPNITTDVNGKARITFYNADPKTTIRVNVQGISNRGMLIAASSDYLVK